MLRKSVSAAIIFAVAGSFAAPALALQETWLDTITRQAEPRHGYQRTADGYCDIVVKRPGGNPTQDMTGSIGHAKSYQSNGGPARKRICR